MSKRMTKATARNSAFFYSIYRSAVLEMERNFLVGDTACFEFSELVSRVIWHKEVGIDSETGHMQFQRTDVVIDFSHLDDEDYKWHFILDWIEDDLGKPLHKVTHKYFTNKRSRGRKINPIDFIPFGTNKVTAGVCVAEAQNENIVAASLKQQRQMNLGAIEATENTIINIGKTLPGLPGKVDPQLSNGGEKKLA